MDERPIRKTYSDEEIADAIAVAESMGSTAKAADMLGIAHRTLRHWVSGDQRVISPDLIDERRLQLADLFVQEMFEILGVMDKKREDASYKDLTVALAILAEKVTMLMGRSKTLREQRVELRWPEDGGLTAKHND